MLNNKLLIFVLLLMLKKTEESPGVPTAIAAGATKVISNIPEIVDTPLKAMGLYNLLKPETTGEFESLLVAMMIPLSQYRAYEIREAILNYASHPFESDKAFIDILCVATNKEIIDINNVYQEMYKSSLVDDFEEHYNIGTDYLNEYFRSLMISLIAANRNETSTIDKHQAWEDAHQLYETGENTHGTIESRFIKILTERSFENLKWTFFKYKRVSKNTVENAIDEEFSGDISKALLAIVKYAKNSTDFFAERFYESMVGAGTNEDDLTRLVVTHSRLNKGDIGKIKELFRFKYGHTLNYYIKDDTSECYRSILLRLIE